jgi:endonuclease/exonuclease/phosphatase family metal-dependent hydrolase
MKQKFIISMLLFAALLIACKDEPAAEAVSLSVTPEMVAFPSDAVTTMVVVKCDRNITAATENDLDRSWCTVNVLTGGIYNLRISVTANEDINRERTAKIIVSAEGAESRYITVRQAGATPQISVKEKQVVLYEHEGFNFSLEVTANIPVAFELPTWITHQSDATSATGIQTHTFVAMPLDEVDTSRDGVLTVRASDPSFTNSVTIPVRQSNKTCVLRVATYNVRCGGCGDDESTGKGWSARKAMVNQLIRTYDFDIFGVQEAKEDYWNQVTDLLVAGSYSYAGVGNDDGIRGGFYNPVIYKTDKFDLLDKGQFWYSDTPDEPSTWDDLNRSCSWGKFREKVSGRTFYFFCSHLSAEDVPSRNKSAVLLKEKIAAIAGNSPVFAVGDYNTIPQTECIRTILNGETVELFDARARSETAPAGTLSTFTAFYLTPEQMNDEYNRLDYIFVSDNVRIKTYSVLGDRPGGAYPSDHDPVLVRAEIE